MTIRESEELDQIISCLDVLDDRRKTVIIHRYGLDGGKTKTLKQIGEMLGISQERIRVLQYTAEWRLKHEWRKRELQKSLADT